LLKAERAQGAKLFYKERVAAGHLTESLSAEA